MLAFLSRISLLFVCLSAPLIAADKKHIAVVEFSVIGDLGIPGAGHAIAEMLLDPIRRTDHFHIMERTLLRSVIEEQHICGSELAEDCIANQIGRIHGVSAIVTGSVVKFGDVVTVEARMIDVTSSEVINTTTLRIPLHQLNDLPTQLNTIALRLSGQTVTIIKPQLTHKQMVGEIQMLLKRHGFDPGVTDGVMGQKTKNAIKTYQQAQQLLVDSKANATLLASLRRTARTLPANLDGLIASMTSKLVPRIEGRRLYINPIVEVNDRYTSPFSEYLTRRLKMTLVDRGCHVIADQQAAQSLANTRSLRIRAKKVQNVRTSDAFFSGADAVLEGVYYRDDKGVNVSVQIKALSGKVLVGAERFISQLLITLPTDNPAAKKMAAIADVKAQNAHGVVHIATGKGGVAPHYIEDERIRFIIQVKKPVYVTIFSIDAQGQAALLFPGQGDEDYLKPGQLYTIPNFLAKWHIQVQPPFGTDIVKIFASDARLTVPTFQPSLPSLSFNRGIRSIGRDRIQARLAQTDTINPFDLVDFFRGQADKKGIQLYEDSLFIKTQQKD